MPGECTVDVSFDMTAALHFCHLLDDILNSRTIHLLRNKCVDIEVLMPVGSSVGVPGGS
jgi:hypothetical protein